MQSVSQSEQQAKCISVRATCKVHLSPSNMQSVSQSEHHAVYLSPSSMQSVSQSEQHAKCISVRAPCKVYLSPRSMRCISVRAACKVYLSPSSMQSVFQSEQHAVLSQSEQHAVYLSPSTMQNVSQSEHHAVYLSPSTMQCISVRAPCKVYLSPSTMQSVCQKRICSDLCVLPQIKPAILTGHTQLKTGRSSPSADPITPGVWQGRHCSTDFLKTLYVLHHTVPHQLRRFENKDLHGHNASTDSDGIESLIYNLCLNQEIFFQSFNFHGFFFFFFFFVHS